MVMWMCCQFVSGNLTEPEFEYQGTSFVISSDALLQTLFIDEGLETADKTIDADLLFGYMEESYEAINQPQIICIYTLINQLADKLRDDNLWDQP